jgi:Na+/melibiose symporter-like transporter
MLFLIQLVPTMNPWWYYGFGAATGVVNWVAVALSALSDVLPQRFRAPGIGLVLAGFSLGIALAPILAFFFNRIHLSLISFLVVLGGLVSTVLFVPETLPAEVAEEARRRRDYDMERTPTDDGETSWFRVLLKKAGNIVARPVKEMAILNRDSFFRLISLLAFFSGMVSSGDSTLLVYYVEDRLGFTEKDVSIILLISGIMGLLVQGIFLKPFNECVGEKMVVTLCFFFGAVDNVMYGLARNKGTIFAAVTLSALTGMTFPTIAAIKANNVVRETILAVVVPSS